MPDLEQAKRAAFIQISNLTAATVEYKIASLEAQHALLLGIPLTEQNQKVKNARRGLDSAYQQVSEILQDYGFREELQQAGAAIMQEVNDDASRLVAQKLGPEKMKSLGLDPEIELASEGWPSTRADVKSITPPPAADTPTRLMSKRTDIPSRLMDKKPATSAEKKERHDKRVNFAKVAAANLLVYGAVFLFPIIAGVIAGVLAGSKTKGRGED